MANIKANKFKTKENKIKISHQKPKVLVILGTTSGGKTALGVRSASELNGEIISADSRQVYKGMDIGTGKDLGEYQVGRQKIPYHLIDVANPRIRFDLAQYQKLAFKAIDDVLKRKKLPIIVGGSGLYLQALVDNYNLVSFAPDEKKRREWGKLSAAGLLERITELKPEFAARLNNSDGHNQRRLARYLEIITAGQSERVGRRESRYDFLLLGLVWPNEILRAHITQRLLIRLEKEGLVAEVNRLHQEGVAWERLKSFGLEYKFVAAHLLGELSYQEMVEKLSRAIYGFAKRQKTWFKRWEKQGARIKWIQNSEAASKNIKNMEIVKRQVEKWRAERRQIEKPPAIK